MSSKYTKKNVFGLIFLGIILIFLQVPCFSQNFIAQFTPEQVMKAHAKAFPDAISTVKRRNKDWAVLLRDRWFYYADGRLLPEEELKNADSWARQSFYGYPEELPPWEEPTGERAERLASVLGRRRANPPLRCPDFYDTLWQATSREEAEANLVSIRFLGRDLPVHKDLAARFKKIDALIREEAEKDKEVKEFIEEIGSIGAWNWRQVALTASRSFHSYAVAVDILPKRLLGRATYWQWTAEQIPAWYTVPYSRRYHQPESVVKIFERYGFCWGGKWALYDTMHFEYRPEIFILYGKEVEEP